MANRDLIHRIRLARQKLDAGEYSVDDFVWSLEANGQALEGLLPRQVKRLRELADSIEVAQYALDENAIEGIINSLLEDLDVFLDNVSQ